MNVYERITNLILEKLYEGTVPWHQPWSAVSWPQNLLSKRHYSGINVFLLTMAGYGSPYWLTFKQARQLGGRVRKAQKGTPIVYWKLLESRDEDEETKQIPLLRYYTVFNLEQCDGIAPPDTAAKEKPWQPLEQCERIVSHMPSKPLIETGVPKAFYNPELDKVNMPAKGLFESSEEYYCTLFHELIHSTGHVSRLNRKSVVEATYFGSATYSKEELIAEMGAAFLCAHAGIENTTIDSSAAYIAGWLKELDDDKRLVIKAAAQAQKAYSYILGLGLGKQEDPSKSPAQAIGHHS